MPVFDVPRAHETLGVVVGLDRQPFAERRADDDDVLGDGRRRVQADLAGLEIDLTMCSDLFLTNLHQAEALAKQMWDEGTRVVIPIWRTDVFGNNLQSLLKEEFEKVGGKVVDGIGYDPSCR